jgi:hypothetical protein
MILKLYGTAYQSVQPNFNPRGLTEIGFKRDRAHSIAAEDFAAAYQKTREVALGAETEGEVHDSAEDALLKKLEAAVGELLRDLKEGEVLVVESQEGEDHPKTRDRKKNVVVEGANRLYFYWWIEPPLRLGVYRKKT